MRQHFLVNGFTDGGGSEKDWTFLNRSVLERNNYVLYSQVYEDTRGKPAHLWTNPVIGRIKYYRDTFGDNFRFITIGDINFDGYFCSIPYSVLKPSLDLGTLYRNGWLFRYYFDGMMGVYNGSCTRRIQNIDVSAYWMNREELIESLQTVGDMDIPQELNPVECLNVPQDVFPDVPQDVFPDVPQDVFPDVPVSMVVPIEFTTAITALTEALTPALIALTPLIKALTEFTKALTPTITKQ
jgi:hypothetical protein